MPFQDIDYYICPWGSTLTERPAQPNGRCVQRTPEHGVLCGVAPQGVAYQKWRIIAQPDDLHLVCGADIPSWVLTHHSLHADEPHGIYDGPISMSPVNQVPTMCQKWRVVLAREYLADNRFPEDVFMFLTNLTLMLEEGETPSCMGLSRQVFTRPQHLLEWKVKPRNDEFNDKNQVFIVRRA